MNLKLGWYLKDGVHHLQTSDLHKFTPIFQFANTFATVQSQLISYYWLFIIIICTVIKVLVKTTVYSLFTLNSNYSNCCYSTVTTNILHFSSALQGYIGNKYHKKVILFLYLWLYSIISYVGKIMGVFSGSQKPDRILLHQN